MDCPRHCLPPCGGGTESEMAEELEISISAVKKCWRSIYDRARASGIGIFAEDINGDVEAVERGKEKKHVLLAYLREHPEELRPTDMKLLARNGDPQKARRGLAWNTVTSKRP